ncbi:MAG TPA: DNA-formamidopyrimidine glycosylase family protein [Caldisericia bacterium]|nr:DNA-formamidopyrimidine glycosylase family protein [Caldisericia bacterium]HPF49486.1 DNA-formamidopyrimidine glycosylase family protein [Caldisericia bacterium]HPI84220.1 DNA-formamidopyrimidine glycosylase family protein [Caldisericia bacterium]HPQ93485.1 DNA-formamidopyrimidine glycosylase family protein [Caldisericia bacterium]HRV75509.1 DNA-formamidopyrimidine glycosylase family protein [Caldisericia bacterium]
MFEIPECTVIANQMNGTIVGKKIKAGELSNTLHKFVWHNIDHDEFSKLVKGKTVGKANVMGRWMTVELDPGYVLLFGECGGKIVYQTADKKTPTKYHLLLQFEDGSHLYAITQMWGAYELYKSPEHLNRDYVRDMRTTPVESGFTVDYLKGLIEETLKKENKSVKGLLTQEQLIPGLGNAIAQDIMFTAKLHPKRKINTLTNPQIKVLHGAIKSTIAEIIAHGGRYDEYTLFGKKGDYVRLMDKNAIDNPCPRCGGDVIKMNYLGGACYVCEECQEL